MDAKMDPARLTKKKAHHGPFKVCINPFLEQTSGQQTNLYLSHGEVNRTFHSKEIFPVVHLHSQPD